LKLARACSAAAIAASIGLAHCGGPTFVVQQYAGPPQPQETIAVIRVDAAGPELVSLDGEPLRGAVEKGTRLHIEVLPGVHEAEVAAPERGMRFAASVRFVADPGKVYRFDVASTGTPPDWVASVYEVDRSTDARRERARQPPVPEGLRPTPRRLAPPEPDGGPVKDAGTADSAADAARIDG
jgi:hypothetical protein